MENATPVPVLCLPDARWACQGCGACCERFTLGPVRPETWGRLMAADLPSRWPPAAEGPWFKVRAFSESVHGFYLTRRNGACVFLDEARQCVLHRLLGEEAKPDFCRLFPFLLVPGPEAVRAVVRPTCPGWHASRHAGAPLGPQAAPLLPLLDIRPHAAEGLVVLLPGLGVERASWEAAESALLRVAATTEGPPEARVAALRRAVQRGIGRPEVPAVPDAAVWARGHLLALLGDTIAALDPGSDDPDPRAALLRRCLGWLHQVAADSPPAACNPDAEDYLGLVLRSLIFAHSPTAPGGLPVIIGAHLLDTWIARAVPDPPGGPLSASLVAERLATWQTVAAHGAVQAALKRAHPYLADLFLHADGP